MFQKKDYPKLIAAILIPVAIVFAVFSSVKVTEQSVDTQQTVNPLYELHDREMVQVKVNDQKIRVEVVNSPSSTMLGLSGRDSIGADGMLFIFPKSHQQYFWMKDMKFPIDMIWIDDGTVLRVTENVPVPDENTPDNKLEIYSSELDVNMVLEVESGDTKRFNIKPGDTIQLVE